jgi:hypothetical protein
MEDESPSSKKEEMISAIYCLQLIRNPKDMKENPENLEEGAFELIKIAASGSYELAAVIVSREELSEILLKTIDEVSSIYADKKKIHQDRWRDYVASNLDTEVLAIGMLK